MQSKSALITGVTGQDGSLLAEYLLTKNYVVIATVRPGFSDENLTNLSLLKHDCFSLIEYQDYSEFEEIIKIHKPSEIYHFAAMSHVGESHKNPKKVFSVNTDWTLIILDSIAKQSPASRMFFASTCEIFDKTKGSELNEQSATKPLNP